VVKTILYKRIIALGTSTDFILMGLLTLQFGAVNSLNKKHVLRTGVKLRSYVNRPLGSNTAPTSRMVVPSNVTQCRAPVQLFMSVTILTLN